MTLVIIPARMNSTRLPGKPLLKIGDRTIIERCCEQARKAGFEKTTYVATDDKWIRDQVHKFTFAQAIMTGECASGTDRVAAAAELIDPDGKHEYVINYQGDMPFLDPEHLKRFARICEEGQAPLVTAFAQVGFVDRDFKRREVYSHIGLYWYSREALRLFAKSPQSQWEKERSLEQLRLSNIDWPWGFVEFDHMPIEINTQADLDRARSCLM